jgi:AcrR family transcriptional regulator
VRDRGGSQGRARGPGRPRSEAAHNAILEATVDILAEHGYSALTIEGVARLARVGKTTIYRRWSSKAALVREAIDRLALTPEVPDSGDVRADLTQMVGSFIRWSVTSKANRVVAALVGEVRIDDELARLLHEDVARRRGALREVIERAVERNQISRTADLELVIDALWGPVQYRLLVTGGPVEEAMAAALVDQLLDGIRTG